MVLITPVLATVLSKRDDDFGTYGWNYAILWYERVNGGIKAVDRKHKGELWYQYWDTHIRFNFKGGYPPKGEVWEYADAWTRTKIYNKYTLELVETLYSYVFVS